uniref:Uncharacterized protein n=1 Tax=Chromera velia CCMP2878 TaxID=1169474 RepID=A0A0K6S6K4_9ALVE|eukprot:Cvel_16081.t2-p1 / transcript=Cvel_16081.t2 / gene=Cvel_16081 / organism=Chromera_velia_CCMP2878 / gene_product=hypothetical protein / transcript_product=hypothetical protein / location=Cvel_scaffold1222:26375-35078(-) / protein_length=632 / sequence_SO=supercontig / SO=protein_coding / is_pseudo=false
MSAAPGRHNRGVTVHPEDGMSFRSGLPSSTPTTVTVVRMDTKSSSCSSSGVPEQCAIPSSSTQSQSPSLFPEARLSIEQERIVLQRLVQMKLWGPNFAPLQLAVQDLQQREGGAQKEAGEDRAREAFVSRLANARASRIRERESSSQSAAGVMNQFGGGDQPEGVEGGDGSLGGVLTGQGTRISASYYKTYRKFSDAADAARIAKARSQASSSYCFGPSPRDASNPFTGRRRGNNDTEKDREGLGLDRRSPESPVRRHSTAPLSPTTPRQTSRNSLFSSRRNVSSPSRMGRERGSRSPRNPLAVHDGNEKHPRISNSVPEETEVAMPSPLPSPRQRRKKNAGQNRRRPPGPAKSPRKHRSDRYASKETEQTEATPSPPVRITEEPPPSPSPPTEGGQTTRARGAKAEDGRSLDDSLVLSHRERENQQPPSSPPYFSGERRYSSSVPSGRSRTALGASREESVANSESVCRRKEEDFPDVCKVQLTDSHGTQKTILCRDVDSVPAQIREGSQITSSFSPANQAGVVQKHGGERERERGKREDPKKNESAAVAPPSLQGSRSPLEPPSSCGSTGVREVPAETLRRALHRAPSESGSSPTSVLEQRQTEFLYTKAVCFGWVRCANGHEYELSPSG